MSTDGQGTKRRRKIAENFNGLSRAHQRYRHTDDRQTDGRTDGTAIAANVNVSSRSLKIVHYRLAICLRVHKRFSYIIQHSQNSKLNFDETRARHKTIKNNVSVYKNFHHQMTSKPKTNRNYITTITDL